MKAKIDVGAARWNREIEPFVRHKKRRGFVVRVVREMNKIGQGRKWFRNQIDRWLSDDPATRSEPLAGIGLVLIDALKRAVEAMDKKDANKKAE